jgi:hypothetical protein
MQLLVVMLVAVMALGSAPSSAANRPRDRQKPSVTMTTADGAVLVGPTGITGQTITGTMRDNRGVRSMSLEYCGGPTPCGVLLSQAGGIGVDAPWHVLCRGGRTCKWEFEIPLDMVGVYELQATAVDAAGNRRTTKPIQVTVVAPCPPCWVP